MPKFFGFYALKKGSRIFKMGLIAIVLIGLAGVGVQAATKLHPIYQIQTDTKVVALTFDISWGDHTPRPVLDILKEANVKATFFLSGPWVKDYPEIPCQIRDEGHEIASHGHRHIDYSNLSLDEIKQEIMKAHNNIKEVTGVEANLIRMPNGDYNNSVIQAAQECQYQAVQWSVDSLDWMNPGVENIVARVHEKIHPGAIILMHASDTCKQTTEALPQILDDLKSQGYTFVTVSELLTMGVAEP